MQFRFLFPVIRGRVATRAATSSHLRATLFSRELNASRNFSGSSIRQSVKASARASSAARRRAYVEHGAQRYPTTETTRRFPRLRFCGCTGKFLEFRCNSKRADKWDQRIPLSYFILYGLHFPHYPSKKCCHSQTCPCLELALSSVT